MKSKESILREKYNFVINHFSSERYNLVFQIFKQVYASNEMLLRRKQFAQCTLQNRILIKLLLEAGFKEGNIEKKWRPFWGIHQYLIINTGKKKFLVDPFFRKLKKIN